MMQQFAFVFTCSPTAPCLSQDLLRQISTFVELECAGALKWLAPEIACEVVAEATPTQSRDLLAALRRAFATHPIDVNIVAAGPGRQKSLLVADMDSTIIQQECIDELADLAGVGSVIRGITERAMQGEFDFETALRERVKLLKGLPVTAIENVLNERIALTGGARELVQTMKHNGAYCALVSGGFTAFTAAIAKRAGFDTHRANLLEVKAGNLTGCVIEPILGREAKLAALEEFISTHDLTQSQSLAVGDGANDLAMIGYAGLGGAFRAKPVVAAAADVAIEHCDLTGFLYLQGFSIDVFQTSSH
ncbi:MAG: phosphoserine phosphatase SerB [Pseudomonadota bacterium]